MEQDKISQLIIDLEIAALEEWNRGNPSLYLDLYTPDFTYFDPMIPKRSDGFEAIREIYEPMRGKGCVDHYEMIDPCVQFPAAGAAVLTYNLHSRAGEQLWRWNCTEVYQQQPDGNWKIIHNHWSLIQPFGDKTGEVV